MARTPRSSLPTGTVTFLFTDIEGSTSLLTKLGERYVKLQERHAELLRGAVVAHGGTEVNTEGDAFFVVFESAGRAVAAAAAAQVAMAAEAWPDDAVIRVRMGLHSGEGRLGGDDYAGLDVNRAARIASAAHGGQVVLSDATRSLAETELPAGSSLQDLGRHRLKDLPDLEHLWQLDLEGLPSRFPAIRSLDARPTNLPPELSPLIGRSRELATARDLLEQRRLLTLTGPGGTGKTRLGLAIAGSLVDEHPDGVFFVDLQETRDPTSVATAIADAVGVRERVDRGPEDSVAGFLQDRTCLLVLDNFEQVMSAASLVARLLERAPHLRLVVTSREALNVRGEQELPVPPLTLPATNGRMDLEQLANTDTVRLFVERAREIRPAFELSETNAASVVEIVRRLDGLPLAIELAAARVRLLSPEAILARLDQSLALLAGHGPDRTDRQQTLRGAIDWSYQLLDEGERRLFDQLAVFAGGWSVEAAGSVCLMDAAGADPFDALASLAEKSLIRADTLDDGEPRFGMLWVIHEFAAERLAQDPDHDAAHRRHAGWHADLAELAEPELMGRSLRAWQGRLAVEQENIRSALRWAIDHDEAGLALRLAGPLWRFWHYRAAAREGRDWLEAVLGLPGAEEPGPDRARALSGLAGLVYWQGDMERAAQLYDEALAIRRELDDRRAVADLLRDSAWTAFGTGALDDAMARAKDALAYYRSAGDETDAALTEAWLAISVVFAGQEEVSDETIASGRRAVEAARAAGRSYEEADWLSTLAFLELERGDFDTAARWGRETLQAFYTMGALGWIGPYFKFFSIMEMRRGNYERAAFLGGMAARYSEDFGGELPDSMFRAGDPLVQSAEFLEPEVYQRVVAEGRAMALDEAVAYALETSGLS